MLERIKDTIGKFIGFLIIVGIIAAIVSVLAIFDGSLMKMFVKVIPKALFSHFKKIKHLRQQFLLSWPETALATGQTITHSQKGSFLSLI